MKSRGFGGDLGVRSRPEASYRTGVAEGCAYTATLAGMESGVVNPRDLSQYRYAGF